VEHYRTNFIPGADANNLILQMRTWEKHDVGATPGFGGDLQKALASIKAQVLYMPSASDLYFPVTDARYEAQFIAHCTLLPIPSLWGHPAGAGASPADLKFLNEHIAEFLKGAGTATFRPMGRLIDSGDIALRQHRYGHAPVPNWPTSSNSENFDKNWRVISHVRPDRVESP
jgi:hypothetical protein